MKIVVINLARATERRKNIVAGLQSLGMDFELFEAVDGLNIPSKYDSLIDRDGFWWDGRHISTGAIGAWLSQRQVLLRMVENGPEIMAILEDDVTFSADFPSVIDALEETADAFDIVFLHHGPRRSFIPFARLNTGHKLGCVRWSHFGCQGYIIKRSAAKRFLEKTPSIRMGIDRALARFWHHGLITYCVRPAVVSHRLPEDGNVSFIGQCPTVECSDRLWKARRTWYHIREGARKKVSLTARVCRSKGPFDGLSEVIRPRDGVR